MSEKEKTIMQAYTRQHYYSSIPRYWNRFHEVKDTMDYYDNNNWTEAGHTAVIGLNGAVNVVTLNVNGIVKQVSSNAYNSILLDMYYELGMNDNEVMEAIYKNSLQKAIKKSTDPWMKFLKSVESTDSNVLEIQKLSFLDDYSDLLCGRYSDRVNENTTTWDLLTQNGLQINYDSNDGSIKQELIGSMSDYGYSPNDLFKDINTVNDAVNNLVAIGTSFTLIEMNDQYRNILIEIRDKAESKKGSGHAWENQDLIDALNYEIGFRENYTVSLTLRHAWDLYNLFTSTSDNKSMGANKILDDVAENMIKELWPVEAASIIKNIHAVQLGTKIGWSLSDKMFNLSNATNLYYKGKAYGLLEEILVEILDEQASDLTYYNDYSLLSDDEILSMYKNASDYDLMFRMYTYVEAEGCKTYANYEKANIIDRTDSLPDQLFGALGLDVEYLVRLVSNSGIDFALSVYSLFDTDSSKPVTVLDPHKQTIEQIQHKYAQRNFNIAYYTHRSDFIKNNLKCHGGKFDTKEDAMSYFQSVSDAYLAILKQEYDMAMVMCPVEVNVYDENHNLVGVISSKRNTLPEDSQVVFAFRNEANDANIIIYPSNYTIEIVSYDNGEMTVWGAHCGDQEIDRMVGYVKMEISDDYVGKFGISSEEDHLTRMPSTKSTLSSIRVNDTEISDFDSEKLEYTVELPEKTSKIPVVSVAPSNEKASVTIAQVASLTGEESDRTATITVTAEDGEHKSVYKVIFALAKHIHVTGEDYSSNETGHWHTCSGCEEKVDFAEHTEDEGEITTDPTEYEEGVKTYRCTVCGYVTRTEPIDKLAHTHKTTEEYTSDETGHWHTCSECDEKVEFAEHTEDEGEVTTEPTEYEEGVKTYRCTVCGYVTRTEPVDKLPHTHKTTEEYVADETGHWHECSECDVKVDFAEHTEDEGEVTTEPTEYEEGVKTYSCTVCSYVIRTEPVDKLAHTHKTTEEYTSDETGHWHTCSECDEKVEFSEHTEDQGEVTTDPTEYEEGVKTYRCTVCGYVTRTEPVDKLPHTHKTTEEYSFDASGHWYACSECDEKISFQTHIEDEGTITIAPTETTEGEKVFKCTECGYITRVEKLSVLEHTHHASDEWKSDETGHWHVCSGCDEKISFETHIEDEGEVTIEPTEENEGEMTYRCTVCGSIIRTEKIDKLPHTHDISEDWTSDETGHWHSCAGCDAKVDFAPHTSDDGEITEEPTEETDGIRTFRCIECGYVTRSEPIERISHTHDVSEGYEYDATGHWHTCADCDERVNFESHRAGNGTVIRSATTTSTGLREYRCIACGYLIRSEIIPMVEETRPQYPVDAPKMTNSEGYSHNYPASNETTATNAQSLQIKKGDRILKVTATVYGNSVKLRWNRLSDVEGYVVYVFKNGRYEELKETKRSTLTVSGLKSGKTYKFIVRYKCSGKLSDDKHSGKVSVNIVNRPRPIGESTEDAILLKWVGVPKSKKYAVYMIVGGKAVKIAETEKCYKSISGLARKTKYQFVVRAYVNGSWTEMKKSDIVEVTTK